VDDDRSLKAEQVAAMLNVQIATIRKWTSQRSIPCIRLSRRAVRYSEKAIREWIQSKTRTERGDTPCVNPTTNRRKRRTPRTGASYDDVNSIVQRAKNKFLNNKVD
jgi:excisionase family DNA binding protein